MKRIILAALVGVLVSGPAWGADDDAVLLHCDGWIENVRKERHGIADNVQIARDGSWIMWAGEEYSWSEKFSTKDAWSYRFKSIGTDEIINFSPSVMSLSATGMGSYAGEGSNFSLYACFPIESPFKF